VALARTSAAPARRLKVHRSASGRRFHLSPGMSYQVADNAEAHRSRTATGATLFIVD